MDLTWNINNIYKSFTCDEFLKDVSEFERYLNIINEIKIEDKDIINNVESFLILNNKYEELYLKLTSYAYLRSIVNVQDEEALNILDKIENKNSQHKQAIICFGRYLKSIRDLNKIIEGSEYISTHKFYLNELLLKSKYLLSANEEFIISKMQEVGSKAYERYYNELVSYAENKVNINDKEKSLTLLELCNLSYDDNPNVRREGFNEQIKLCESISEQCAKCINGIAGEANILCEIRGYKSPLEKVLINYRMDSETLDAMMAAIEESLPMFHKYYKKKANILGYKYSLPFYDVFAPIGSKNKFISYKECRDIIVSAFYQFSDNLGKFANEAFEKRWIDAMPRKEKVNYGVSIDIFPLKESRISVNFNNTINDVSILAHELGHSYHGYNLYNETMLNTNIGESIAETASIFCEVLLSNDLLKSVDKDEKIIFLEKSISDAAYFLVEFYGRYLFEKELYKKRKNKTLSVTELNNMMIKSMQRVFGDSIDEKTINPYMWLNKAGYFMAGNEFLNFPYSFGVLFSRGLYAEYLKQGKAFVDKYDDFLSKTSKNSIVDIGKLMNIDVHDINFWRSSLKLIEKDIEMFIDLA